MLKKLKNKYYRFEEQIKIYNSSKSKLSDKEKYKLIDNLLTGSDFWGYFELITKIAYELADDSDKYCELLEKVYLKVKNDMASAPFFNMLVDLGQNKKDIGIKIYNKIQGESNNEGLKDVLGFILGGYSMNDNTILYKLTEDKKLVYPDTIIILKAIMVKSEKLFDKDNNYDLSEKEYEFLDFVSQTDDERFLKELMNLYRFLYHINKTYFYKKIKDLMSKKKSSINSMIWIFKERLKLSNAQILDLAELTKDCDEYAISELISSLTHNKSNYSSQEIKQISELFIYWINKNLEFKVRFFNYSLEELSKKNIKFLDYFLDNYEKIEISGKSLDYNFLFPRIFERLIRHRIKESIPKLLKRNIEKKDAKLFYRLSDKIVGIIYKISNKEEAFDLFLPLAERTQEVANKEDFINENKKSFNKLVKNKSFDKLIDYIKDLLSQLMFRKREFDFDEIYKNLAKFKKLNGVVKSKLEKLQKDRKYSPMFWLGSQKRDKELKQSYLQEVENFIIKSEKISNEKNNDDNTRDLISGLGDEHGFWNTFSEMIFANKFISNSNSILEPQIPNKDKNADLVIELNNKKIFFEVTNPETNRNVHIDNGAVGVKNKLDYIIRKKSAQFFSKKTFDEMKDKTRKDLFFIVVDSSRSMIDEYMIENSFYGSLAVEFYVSTGGNVKTPPSKTIRKDDAVIKNKEFISGLIYFKPQLVNLDEKIKFILTGDIISNPDAINKITPEDYKKLRRIIFGK